MSRIKEFRILEELGGTEVLFHIPEMKGLPPENKGVTDLLNIIIPRVTLPAAESDSAPTGILGSLLRDRFIPEQVQSARRAGRDGAELKSITHVDRTVRELLDYYYPGRWWISDGRVCTTMDRFGPIGWRVKTAVREVREE
jgi:hypothetical protein